MPSPDYRAEKPLVAQSSWDICDVNMGIVHSASFVEEGEDSALASIVVLDVAGLVINLLGVPLVVVGRGSAGAECGQGSSETMGARLRL